MKKCIITTVLLISILFALPGCSLNPFTANPSAQQNTSEKKDKGDKQNKQNNQDKQNKTNKKANKT